MKGASGESGCLGGWGGAVTGRGSGRHLGGWPGGGRKVGSYYYNSFSSTTVSCGSVPMFYFIMKG